MHIKSISDEKIIKKVFSKGKKKALSTLCCFI